MMGLRRGSPYTAAVDDSTKRGTRYFRTACSRLRVRAELLSKYFSGQSTDSPASMNAAKCITASKRPCSKARSITGWSPVSARMNSACAGTASRWPLQRLSSTVTECPLRSRRSATTPPMYPAPPVTITRIRSCSLQRDVRQIVMPEPILAECMSKVWTQLSSYWTNSAHQVVTNHHSTHAFSYLHRTSTMADQLQLLAGTLELACSKTLVVIQTRRGVNYLSSPCLNRLAPP